VSNIANLQSLKKTEASFILIDLRPKDQIEKGHIPGAVAAPDGKVDALKGQFPSFKAANIILYGKDGDLAACLDAFKAVAGWEYKEVSILDVGFAGWEKAGKDVAKGAAASEIKYVRKLRVGEIEIAQFKALVDKPSAEFVIVDVRNKSEFDEAALPNTINVPLEELESRLSELPKDKTFAVHCGTGARAEMAYTVLEKAGFKVKYLKAKVTPDKEKKGQYTISD
jgi:rhodanese-related sulfurtransferase